MSKRHEGHRAGEHPLAGGAGRTATGGDAASQQSRGQNPQQAVSAMQGREQEGSYLREKAGIEPLHGQKERPQQAVSGMQSGQEQRGAVRPELTVGEQARTAMGKAGNTVKEGMVGSLKGINEIEAEIVTLVRNTVADTLHNSGAVATAGVSVAKDVLKGAIAAVDEIGTGLTVGTKSVAKGVMMGVSDVGGDLASVARMTVKGAVNGAAEIGADVGVVARRTVDGILEATREIGGNVEHVAQEVVTGAIEAAGAIGTAAVNNVRGMLVGVVEGAKEVIDAAVPKGAGERQSPQMAAQREESATAGAAGEAGRRGSTSAGQEPHRKR